MSRTAYLFEHYMQEAFRLELLPDYNIPSEQEGLKLFYETGHVQGNPDLVVYLEDAKAKIQKGAAHRRVRILDVPINDYQRYEILVSYRVLADMGGDMLFIDRPDFETHIAPQFGDIPVQDFWMFDQSSVALFDYTSDGQWLGAKIIDDVEIIRAYKAVRLLLIDHAYDLADLEKRYNLA